MKLTETGMKLTKQQAEWLIERLDMYHVHSHCSLICEACEIKYGEVKSVINQCTEQEFPTLSQRTQTESFSVSLSHAKKFVEFGHGALSCNLSFEQFKQFTAGCNKIVEWLEQND